MRAVILKGVVLGAFVAAGCASGGPPGVSGDADGRSRGVRVTLPPDYANAVFLDALVEVKPQLLRMPPVAYPDSLRLAGVQGRVVIEFVIDTLGRAEPRSLRVVESAHAMLDEPALYVIREAEFKPGEVAGRRVRVLVKFPIDFKLQAPQ